MEQMVMMKILLVDDDPYFIEGITNLFNWKEHNYVIVGNAVNGEAALILCHSQMPDIIITDIRMPVMDGLLFSDYVRRLLPKAGIILLTSYPNFEYAQRAMNLKIQDYLLKNDKDLEEKLFLALNQKRIGILRQREEDEERESYRTFVHDSAVVLKDAFYQNLLISASHKQPLPETEFKFRTGRVGYMHLEINRGLLLEKRYADEEKNVLVDAFRQGIQSFLRESPLEFDFFSHSDFEFGIVFQIASSLSSEDLIISTLYPMGRNLINYIKRAFHFDSTVYIGPLVSSLERLHEVWQCIEKAKNRRFYEGIGKAYVSTESGVYAEGRFNEVQLHWLNVLEHLLENPYTDGNPRSLDTFQREIQESRPDPVLLKRWTRFWLEKTFQSPGRAEEVSEIQFHEIENELQSLELFSDLKQWVAYQISRLSQRSRIPMRREIREAIRYIEENYREAVTASVVAEIVGFSISQFCREFKRYTGESFTDYLLRYRINRAKELILKNKYDKLYKISEEVGIENFGHFSKLFQRYTGKKPKEFQKQEL